jgi:hypothetical protein
VGSVLGTSSPGHREGCQTSADRSRPSRFAVGFAEPCPADQCPARQGLRERGDTQNLSPGQARCSAPAMGAARTVDVGIASLYQSSDRTIRRRAGMETERSRVSCVIAMILTAIAVLLPFVAFFVTVLTWQPSWGEGLR